MAKNLEVAEAIASNLKDLAGIVREEVAHPEKKIAPEKPRAPAFLHLAKKKSV